MDATQWVKLLGVLKLADIDRLDFSVVERELVYEAR